MFILALTLNHTQMNHESLREIKFEQRAEPWQSLSSWFKTWFAIIIIIGFSRVKKKNTVDVKQWKRISSPASDDPVWTLTSFSSTNHGEKSEGVSTLSQSSLSSEAFCLSAVSERAELFMARCISQVARWMVRKAPPAAHIQFLLSQLWVFMLHAVKQTVFEGKNKNSQSNSEGIHWDCFYGSIYWTAKETAARLGPGAGSHSKCFDGIPNIDTLVPTPLPQQYIFIMIFQTQFRQLQKYTVVTAKTFVSNFTADLNQDLLQNLLQIHCLHILQTDSRPWSHFMAVMTLIFTLMSAKTFASDFSCHLYNLKANQQPLKILATHFLWYILIGHKKMIHFRYSTVLQRSGHCYK